MAKNSFHPINTFSQRPLLSAIVLVLAGGVANANTINVNDIGCTLVNAINNANADADTDGKGGCPAGKGADTLQLTRKLYELTISNNKNDGSNALPLVTSVITINGDPLGIGRRTTIFRGPSTPPVPGFRLLNVAQTGRLLLKDVVIKRFSTSYYTFSSTGGAIINAGVLTLKNSTLTNNRAEGYQYFDGAGGGIHNNGTLMLVNSSVVKNYAGTGHDGFGGGISNKGTLTLINSSVVGNRVGSSSAYRSSGSQGGGIFNGGGKVILINSTISGNFVPGNCDFSDFGAGSSEPGKGGGIFSTGGEIKLRNSTVTNNTAAENGCDVDGSYPYYKRKGVGGGIAVYGGRVTLTNSLIANSKQSPDCSNLTTTPFDFVGVNLIEDGSCGIAAAGVHGLTGDPKLMLLSDNGGSLPTYALMLGSPAVDKASDLRCTPYDQRGVKRPQGEHCDIGAYEQIQTASAAVKLIVDFFDQSVREGNLQGTGTNITWQALRLKTWRNQLLVVGDLIDQNLKAKACYQFKRTLSRVDPDNSPDKYDFVTGVNAGILVDYMMTLHDWKCT
ncbi:MAG: choice-of-anchor Q domain-containing protein [Methylovulum miyakonense]|uniref:choice-of-anchor Q domain-containing protein n=1 Tax=Methylovulum miyakonense TaxID=645578 RepID=UPI003BB4A0A7